MVHQFHKLWDLPGNRKVTLRSREVGSGRVGSSLTGWEPRSCASPHFVPRENAGLLAFKTCLPHSGWQGKRKRSTHERTPSTREAHPPRFGARRDQKRPRPGSSRRLRYSLADDGQGEPRHLGPRRMSHDPALQQRAAPSLRGHLACATSACPADRLLSYWSRRL